MSRDERLEAELARLISGELDPDSPEGRAIMDRTDLPETELARLRELAGELEAAARFREEVCAEADAWTDAPGVERIAETLERLASPATPLRGADADDAPGGAGARVADRAERGEDARAEGGGGPGGARPEGSGRSGGAHAEGHGRSGGASAEGRGRSGGASAEGHGRSGGARRLRLAWLLPAAGLLLLVPLLQHALSPPERPLLGGNELQLEAVEAPGAYGAIRFTLPDPRPVGELVLLVFAADDPEDAAPRFTHAVDASPWSDAAAQAQWPDAVRLRLELRVPGLETPVIGQVHARR